MNRALNFAVFKIVFGVSGLLVCLLIREVLKRLREKNE